MRSITLTNEQALNLRAVLRNKRDYKYDETRKARHVQRSITDAMAGYGAMVDAAVAEYETAQADAQIEHEEDEQALGIAFNQAARQHANRITRINAGGAKDATCEILLEEDHYLAVKGWWHGQQQWSGDPKALEIKDAIDSAIEHAGAIKVKRDETDDEPTSLAAKRRA